VNAGTVYVAILEPDEGDDSLAPDALSVHASLCGAEGYVRQHREADAARVAYLVVGESLVHSDGRVVPWAEDWQWRLWGSRRVLTRRDVLGERWAIEAVDVQS
jgi:hypothetical protein